MCGIVGILAKNSRNGNDFGGALDNSLKALKHRGPDDRGLYEDKNIFMGHQRLSIIDLSSEARQPISNEDETVWLTYNGEIYNFRELRSRLEQNHKFKSRSDSEVIVHLYEEKGESLFSHLRGMFAFGLWDRNKRRLLIARDRFGIKPLYYYQTSDFFIFASEIKSLLASGLVPHKLNEEALVNFLRLGSVTAPQTIIGGVYSVMPGDFLKVTEKGIAISKYWDLEFTSQNNSKNECVSKTEQILRESVELHMVSDVPVGVFLSGGLDSSSILALASEVSSSPLKTISITFEEESFDESRYLRLMAEKYETDHQEIPINNKDFLAELPTIFKNMDQPTIDGVNTYFISKAAKSAGLKVALSGLGGDEVFLGYPHYMNLDNIRKYIQILKNIPSPIRTYILTSATRLGKLYSKRSWEKLSYLTEPSLENYYTSVRGLYTTNEISRLTGAKHNNHISHSFDIPKNVDPAMAINYMEIKLYLHDQLLRDTDAMGMAHSVEVRVPFLDHSLMEHVRSIPTSFKLDRNINKILLTKAMDKRLPKEITMRKKMGFVFPLERWIMEYSEELKEMSIDNNIIKRGAIENVWNNFDKGKNHWSKPWALVAVSQWMKNNLT